MWTVPWFLCDCRSKKVLQEWRDKAKQMQREKQKLGISHTSNSIVLSQVFPGGSHGKAKDISQVIGNKVSTKHGCGRMIGSFPIAIYWVSHLLLIICFSTSTLCKILVTKVHSW